MPEPHLKLWALYLQALGPFFATLAVAILSASLVWQQIKIAREQAMLAREKLKHDLFERRYEIYFAFERMLRGLMGDKDVGTDEANMRAANIAAAKSAFLLDPATTQYLFDLHNIAFRKTKYGEAVSVSDLPAEYKLQLTTQWMEDNTIILNAIPILSEKFRPFLQLRDFRAK